MPTSSRPSWPGRFTDKVVVVTGGARGIGRATAERFAREGAGVFALDIVAGDGATEAAAGLVSLHCDVSDEESVCSAIGEIARSRGSIDVLVNNAGVNAYFDATTMSSGDWDAVMGVDLKGAWLCAKHAVPLMLGHGGVIVNVASVHALATVEGMFPYAVAKSGIIGMTRSLALDYAREGVRVVAVCPGYVRTALLDDWLARQEDPAEAERAVLAVHPLGRLATPEDVAGCIAFLASEDAGFVTGSSLVVDGGLTSRVPGP